MSDEEPQDFGIGESQVNPRDEDAKNLAQGEVGSAAMAARGGAAAGARAAMDAERHMSAAAAAAASEAARAARGNAMYAAGSASSHAGQVFGSALARIRAAGLIAERQARAIFANAPAPDLHAISAATGASLAAVAEVVPIVQMDMGSVIGAATAAGGAARGAGTQAAAAAAAAAGAAATAAGGAAAAAGRAAGAAGTIAYDSAGNVITATGDMAGRAGAVAYDAAGNAIGSAKAMGGMAYDSAGNVIGKLGEVADSAGTVAYDAAGNVIGSAAAMSAVAYDSAGNAIGTVGDLASRTGAIAYDAAGNAIGSATAMGAEAYDSAGNVIGTMGEVAGRAGAEAFDAAGNAVGSAGALASSAGAAAFDAAGNAFGSAAAMGAEAFDAAGNVIGTVGEVAGRAGVIAYDAAGNAIGNAAAMSAPAFDAAGRVIGTMGEVAGRAGAVAYDAAGHAVGSASALANSAAYVAGSAASGAAEFAGHAASAAAPIAGQIAGATGQIAGQAGAAVSSGAQAASAAAASALSAAANSGVGQSAQAFLVNARDTAGEVGGFAWDAAGQAYDVSREALAAALAVAAGGFSALWGEIIKVEIFRDVYQQLAVLFQTVARSALEATTNFFSYIATFISFDWQFTFKVNPIYIIALVVIIALIIIILYIWMMCTASGLTGDTNELKHGAEAKTWEEIKEERKHTITAIKYITTASLSIYLPVSKMTIQVLSCDYELMNAARSLFTEITCTAPLPQRMDGFNNTLPATFAECDCSLWPLYTPFQVVSGFLILIFVLGLPILCYRLIQKNKPIGSETDPTKRYMEVNGKEQLVEYTSAMYQQDLRTDPRQLNNPFLFLYEGYDRPWAFYKVVVMIFKLLVVLPALLLARQGTLASSLALLAVLALYAGLSFWAAPFINPQADRMDAIGRIASMLTVGLALVGSPEVAPSANPIMGILINVVNVINFLALLALMLYSLPPVKRFLKNRLGRFTFSDTTMDITGRADKIVPEWIVYDELRNRIWRPFWQALLMQADPSVPTPGDKEAEEAAKNMSVEEKQLTITRRLQAQRQVYSTVGIARVKNHWKSLTLPGLLDTFGWVQFNLEGVDVYFDGLPHDKHRDWTTGFGKMFVRPYPFACVMIYDEGGDYTYVYGADPLPAVEPSPVNDTIARDVAAVEAAWGRQMTAFERFVYLNRDNAEVARQRHVRQSLRSLQRSGTHFPFDFTKTVMRSVTVQRTNSEGKVETKSELVSVELTFSRVVVGVGANSDKAFAAGFKASVTGIDGRGSAHSSDGKRHEFNNQRESAPVAIGAGYPMTENLARLLGSSEARAAVDRFIPVMKEEVAAYRAELYEKRAKEEQALSNAFYLHVFDAFPIPRPALEAYLEDFEQNPVMKAIPKEHAAGLDFLYARVHRVTQHPVAAFWFLFFQDLWAENQDMACFKSEELRAKWDPRYPDALCYRPMPRDDLVKELDEQGLHKGRGLFDDALLDLLFSQIEVRTASVANPVQRAKALADAEAAEA
ncbi:hypothetical protein FNF29_01237 [Cafeteria roenbergensis]|uniref:Uncharacterized protein n=1 Tax=Cafeteria roenbergensis TaxID=33653 RepID=A0A5A8CTQ4_CAFRO|nr:hypothetical protein FNF29_01237 [Cafeteria roenbergensis]|eukprot:KAA0156446.1 hypothetical protein FNF29_01237 [Cafeteria roenbergensis]